MTRRHNSLTRSLESFSSAITRGAGSTPGFTIALSIVLIWAMTGPLFGFSDTWQLVINTGTTVITFLMVFLLQRAQNKDAMAIQLKLNELVAAIEGASNRLIDVEDLSEAELKALHGYYGQLVVLAKKDLNISQSHSIEEARSRHKRKQRPASSG